MNDNRLLCTSVGRSIQVCWFSVQYSYFEVEKFLDIAAEQAAMNANKKNYIQQTRCRYEISHLYE